jgi:hypothetical protein
VVKVFSAYRMRKHKFLTMNPIIELWSPQTKMCGSHLTWVPHKYLMNPRGSHLNILRVPHEPYSWSVDDVSHQCVIQRLTF